MVLVLCGSLRPWVRGPSRMSPSIGDHKFSQQSHGPWLHRHSPQPGCKIIIPKVGEVFKVAELDYLLGRSGVGPLEAVPKRASIGARWIPAVRAEGFCTRQHKPCCLIVIIVLDYERMTTLPSRDTSLGPTRRRTQPTRLRLRASWSTSYHHSEA